MSYHYHPKRNAKGEALYKKVVRAVFEHPETRAAVTLEVEANCAKDARPAWIEVKAEWVQLYDRHVRECAGIDPSWDTFDGAE